MFLFSAWNTIGAPPASKEIHIPVSKRLMIVKDLDSLTHHMLCLLSLSLHPVLLLETSTSVQIVSLQGMTVPYKRIWSHHHLNLWLIYLDDLFFPPASFLLYVSVVSDNTWKEPELHVNVPPIFLYIYIYFFPRNVAWKTISYLSLTGVVVMYSLFHWELFASWYHASAPASIHL